MLTNLFILSRFKLFERFRPFLLFLLRNITTHIVFLRTLFLGLHTFLPKLPQLLTLLLPIFGNITPILGPLSRSLNIEITALLNLILKHCILALGLLAILVTALRAFQIKQGVDEFVGLVSFEE